MLSLNEHYIEIAKLTNLYDILQLIQKHDRSHKYHGLPLCFFLLHHIQNVFMEWRLGLTWISNGDGWISKDDVKVPSMTLGKLCSLVHWTMSSWSSVVHLNIYQRETHWCVERECERIESNKSRGRDVEKWNKLRRH